MSTLADRVKDHTASIGTGAITLSGNAPTGFRTFATAFGSGSTVVNYCMDDAAGKWEVGSGVFNGTTGLTRAAVLSSSNANALVNFVAGTKTVFCTAPAALLDTAGDYRASNFVAGTHYLAPTGSASGLTGLPATLPASDVYAWAKAAAKPSYTKAELGLSNVPNVDTTNDYRAANFAAGTAYLAPNGSASGLSELPTSLPASDVSAWAKAATKPSYTKAEIGLGNVQNIDTALSSISYSYTGALVGEFVIALDSPKPVQLGGSGGTVPSVSTKWANTVLIFAQPFLTSLTFGDLQGVTGPMTITGLTALTALSFPSLTTVIGDFRPYSLYILTTLSLPSLTTIVGNFNSSSLNSLTTLSAPALTTIGGSFSPSSLGAMTSLSLPELTTIGGAFSPSSLGALATVDLSALTTVMGNFTPSSIAALTTLTLPALTTVVGQFSPSSMGGLMTLSLPALTTVGGAFSPSGLNSLTTLSIPSLATVVGAFSLSSLGSLTSLSLPSLTTVTGAFSPSWMLALTTVSAPVLQTVTGTFNPGSFNFVPTLSFPALTTIGGAVTLNYFGALTALEFPAIEVIGETVTSGSAFSTYSTAVLQTFTLGASLQRIGASTAGNFLITSCALLQASVDGILVRLAALDGTAGTTAFNNRTVTITGTSATPSSTGLAAKATLVARGCTVTHN